MTLAFFPGFIDNTEKMCGKTICQLFWIYLLMHSAILTVFSYPNPDPECLLYWIRGDRFEVCNETKHGFHVEWLVKPKDIIYAGEIPEASIMLHITNDSFYKIIYEANMGNKFALSNWSEVKADCLGRDNIQNCTHEWYYDRRYRCCNTLTCMLKADTCSVIDYFSYNCYPEGVQSMEAKVDFMDVYNRTCVYEAVHTPGNQTINPKFTFAGVEIYVQAKMVVIPARVCGDENCDVEIGESCDTCPMDCGKCPFRPWQIGLVVGFSIFGVLLVVAVVMYIHVISRKRLYDESWLIPFALVKEGKSRQGKSGSRMGSMFSTTSTGGAARQQFFVKIAMVHDRTCAVRVVKKKEFSLTMPIRKEVRVARACDHANVCKFIGATVTAPNIWVLTEYCPKGNLSDVLLNEEIPLNWAFRFSFASDIAKGMNHLHSNGIMHGRLKANNCVLDDRWTVKITDFGLKNLRKNEDLDMTEKENDEIKEKRAIIYVAPEHVGVKEYMPTKEGDVYAYAIILIEIATRQDSFGDMDMYSDRKSWKPPLPDLSAKPGDKEEDICPSTGYVQLISDCWMDNPKSRPTYSAIGRRLTQINPIKLSAVDLMMLMMEKYSKHLEVIVAERTKDLVAEKAKADRLLYSMLPMAVANELRQGRPVEARYYDGCTIYFSDIVGFTVISGSSTAIQVVNLLNKLYITFDEIIDNYNVYKVETIGDAYMVVSGIPVETPHHGQEIASMAIDIVTACLVFVIPHMPGHPLKIRVGLHSGKACAGVVGLKMPRYCLFGDTVNTASRMESNGEAYRIHISNFTYEELVKTNKYVMELRGTIPIKGKGDMTTWWLQGYDPQYLAELTQQKEQAEKKKKKPLSVWKPS